MEEENRKRPVEEEDDSGREVVVVVAGKRARTPAISDDSFKTNTDNDDEMISSWLCIDEESVSELAKLLETEVTSPVKVKFIDDPYSSALIFQSSSSYITINGNEESCGSSFSDSDSSVMASIDTGGINIGFLRAAWGLNAAAAAAAEGECSQGFLGVKGMDGFDCCDLDEEMLARFLGEDFLE
ncbi:hypothetical protein LOK49_LG13G00813 [Camellia lanceoleosa]|uniref:Uncharacterized protein n=1 Tax=Camellia lanceoleosa TaxID=1840588 RepID=A0ACC0FJN1_9ERIC|nr:hypothetical protein LOK49_LG13G00813 [Camellia lanceoleosa]